MAIDPFQLFTAYSRYPDRAKASDFAKSFRSSLTKYSQATKTSQIRTLYSLSQDVQLRSLPPTSSATMRRSWGVASKNTGGQLETVSQQRREAASKQARAEAKRLAEEKKISKSMLPRKDDVSQLIDEFSELGSSP